MHQALEDLWWTQHGVPPHVADEMPAVRAAHLKAVWIIHDQVAAAGSDPDADAARLADARRKAGWTT